MFGVPTSLCVYVVVAIFGHIFLTRLRPGWHITAIGGSRRSAYNTGIAVRRTIALLLRRCGVLTAIGALFFAARLATVGGDIGVGLEVLVLTAAVLGGISLGGGTRLGRQGAGRHAHRAADHQRADHAVGCAAASTAWCCGILLLAAVIDIRWLKNRHRIVNKVYVSPTYHDVPPPPSTAAGLRHALRAERQAARRRR